jgi:hypothetical protein
MKAILINANRFLIKLIVYTPLTLYKKKIGVLFLVWECVVAVIF